MTRYFQISKPRQWQIVIGLFLAIVMINFLNIARVHAKSECSPWLEVPKFGLNCWFETNVNKLIAEFPGVSMIERSELHFRNMLDDMEQELVKTMNFSKWKNIEKHKKANKTLVEAFNTVDWQTYTQQTADRFRQELKAAMEMLFDNKIRPLLKDIDKVIKSNTRIESLDTIIQDELKQLDQIILTTFQQYHQIANDTIKKIHTEIITHTIKQANEFRHQKIAHIKTEIIAHATNTFQKNVDETIDKIEPQLIRHAVIQLDNLRQEFRQKVGYFFEQTKYFINTVDCNVEGMLEEFRQYVQRLDQDLSLKVAPFSLDINMTGSPFPVASVQGNVSIEPQKDDTPLKLKSNLFFCYQKLGLNSLPEPWEYSTIYELQTCKVLRTLTPETPIKRILNVYIDLKAWAAKMACVQGGANHHATQHYIWDWLEFGYLYNLWYAYY